MGFKKIVAGLTFLGAATFAESMGKMNEIGMGLARPNIENKFATTGTRKACELEGQIINNTCISTNAQIEAAVSEGFTCHSAEIDGKTRVTCETSTEKCNEEEVKSRALKLKAQGSQVTEHYCAKLTS